MRNPMSVAARQTTENAKALVDSEHANIRPAKLSRNIITRSITARLLAEQEAGAVLDVLDRNDWRDENIVVAERIIEGWNRLK